MGGAGNTPPPGELTGSPHAGPGYDSLSIAGGPKFWHASVLSEGLVKTGLLGLFPGVLIQWIWNGLRICFSSKFPDDVMLLVLGLENGGSFFVLIFLATVVIADTRCTSTHF